MSKVKIESIEEKKMTNGNPFWIVKSEGKSYFCFDKKIVGYGVGDEIEVEVKERDGTDFEGNPIKRFYIQFPKEKAFKGSGIANVDAMLLSYAKDLEIALLEKTKEQKTIQQCLDEIQFIYETFKNLIGGEK
jgi:hypothetical protein